jgi:N-carbamoylputrescine amidase
MPEIGLIQMRCSPDPSENLENGIALIREAAAQGAQIICLPELFKTVYFCQEENHKYFEYGVFCVMYFLKASGWTLS